MAVPWLQAGRCSTGLPCKGTLLGSVLDSSRITNPSIPALGGAVSCQGPHIGGNFRIVRDEHDKDLDKEGRYQNSLSDSVLSVGT